MQALIRYKRFLKSIVHSNSPYKGIVEKRETVINPIFKRLFKEPYPLQTVYNPLAAVNLQISSTKAAIFPFGAFISCVPLAVPREWYVLRRNR